MRVWRNWQTRTFEGRMGDRMGSSPIIRTKMGYFEGKNLQKPLFFLLKKCDLVSNLVSKFR